jgi:hypothetical protein
MSRRKWQIDLLDPDRFQIILGDEPNRFFIRTSALGVNYIADFIERFEETYRRKARILEYGDGLSTLWYAKNFPDNEVVSVGGDEWWFNWIEEELGKIGNKNIHHIYRKASNFYTTERDPDTGYTHVIDDWVAPFDIIINDGAQREMVGDYILSNADNFISVGGIYIRHDYEMAILGNWVGLRNKLPEWCRDEKDLGYEGFCHTHPEYSVLVTTGNGLAGECLEFGGVWRKEDFKWHRKLEVEKEADAKVNI